MFGSMSIWGGSWRSLHYKNGKLHVQRGALRGLPHRLNQQKAKSARQARLVSVRLGIMSHATPRPVICCAAGKSRGPDYGSGSTGVGRKGRASAGFRPLLRQASYVSCRRSTGGFTRGPSKPGLPGSCAGASAPGDSYRSGLKNILRYPADRAARQRVGREGESGRLAQTRARGGWDDGGDEPVIP